MPPKRIRPLILILFLVVLAAAASAGPLKTGDKAPPFSRRDLKGKIWSLDALAGSGSYAKPEERKAILLNFFATYCEPCKKKVPAIKALAEKYGPRGFAVFYISTESKSILGRFAENERFPFTILHDIGGIMTNAYGIGFIPSTVLVDPDGSVRLTVYGSVENIERSLTEKLDEILPPVSP